MFYRFLSFTVYCFSFHFLFPIITYFLFPIIKLNFTFENRLTNNMLVRLMRSNTIPVDTTKPETILRLSLEEDLRVARLRNKNRDPQSPFHQNGAVAGDCAS